MMSKRPQDTTRAKIMYPTARTDYGKKGYKASKGQQAY